MHSGVSLHLELVLVYPGVHMARLGDILEPFQLAAGCDFSLRPVLKSSNSIVYAGLLNAVPMPFLVAWRALLPRLPHRHGMVEATFSFRSLLLDFGEAFVCRGHLFVTCRSFKGLKALGTQGRFPPHHPQRIASQTLTQARY